MQHALISRHRDLSPQNLVLVLVLNYYYYCYYLSTLYTGDSGNDYSTSTGLTGWGEGGVCSLVSGGR